MPPTKYVASQEQKWHVERTHHTPGCPHGGGEGGGGGDQSLNNVLRPGVPWEIACRIR
jgi:hypothetical protein